MHEFSQGAEGKGPGTATTHWGTSWTCGLLLAGDTAGHTWERLEKGEEKEKTEEERKKAK